MNKRTFRSRGLAVGLRSRVCFAIFLLAIVPPTHVTGVEVPSFVSAGDERGLVYVSDDRGNRVPDFSHAGYGGGGVPLPDAPVRVVVSPVEGDDGARIQAALDHVSQRAPDAAGLRGAVLLTPGRFEIAGSLRLGGSGVVLRGSGSGVDGTVLVATGDDRRTLIEISGAHDRVVGAPAPVADAYVPCGATSLRLSGRHDLRPGDTVLVERPSSPAWIERVGMHDAPSRPPLVWKPGTLNVVWDRTVVAVSGDEITLDAPLTTALERELGGGTVAPYRWPGRIGQVGVENLRCESAFDPANPGDEEHAWIAVGLDSVINAWIRNVTALHFAGSMVDVRAGAKWVTVQDCVSLAPVSELAGYRRHTFHTVGQLTLFQRCIAEEGRHDFTVGYLAAGPNVFLDCQARRTHGFSGSIGSWASGVLFDNVHVDGGGLRLDHLEDWNQDVGWAAANSVIWQSSAARMIVRRPPGADNWATGVWSQFAGSGHWSHLNAFVQPQSLYRGQLAERRGAAAMTSLTPRPPPITAQGAQRLEDAVPDLAARLAPRPAPAGRPLALLDGWLAADGVLLAGAQIESTTWRGHLLPERAPERGVSLTRFVPGRSGMGYTDDFAETAATMIAGNQVALRYHWGLWYDQRRGDHQMVRRADGDVWPPFFEQPWARTGRGTAWNGLSQYDLTRFNPWYFRRIREFAEISRVTGLVLINEMYFQHNILEAGSHWVDSPWRPANAVQATGFPEPPVFAEGKRIFMAEAFYDVTHPVRRALHRAYIRKCLENLAGQPNVIHTTSDEYTGPREFVEFWLDVVDEWIRETGQRPLIALSATKDVQDAILADPRRSRLISVIDLKYWWYTDTEVYAPPGGRNRSPRQHERLWRGGRPTAASIARMAGEYRRRHPDKAVITGLPEADGWTFVAAGGSLPNLPADTDPELRAALVRMQPRENHPDAPKRQWTLAEPGRQYLVVVRDGEAAVLDLRAVRGRYSVARIDAATGRVSPTEAWIDGGGIVSLAGTPGPRQLHWLVAVP